MKRIINLKANRQSINITTVFLSIFTMVKLKNGYYSSYKIINSHLKYDFLQIYCSDKNKFNIHKYFINYDLETTNNR
jgi:hypothetical protein